ncbi:MAG: hypothetical protein PVJ17_17100 [Lysobacterales bacterium]|jgi:hypothetical protein
MSGAATTLDRIRGHLVGLKMSRALEALDHCVRRVEEGELSEKALGVGPCQPAVNI